MNPSNYKKNIINKLNSYLIVPLLSFFATGTLLLLISFFFGLEILKITSNVELFQTFILITIVLGFILIGLGVVESFGIIKKVKKIISILIETNNSGIVTYPTTPQSLGIGGGLKIIRPNMPASEVKPLSKDRHKPESKQSTSLIGPNLIPSTEKIKDKLENQVDISLEEGLQMIINRYNDPKVSKSFSNWDNTLMMTFKDLNKSFLFKINKDQGIELVEDFDKEAAVQVNIDSTTFLKMMTKEINPIKAYSSGGLEVKGQMKNLLKLRKLMF